MTREEAIYWLEHKDEDNAKFWTAVAVAISALEQPEQCEDAISRADAIEAFNPDNWRDWYTPEIVRELQALPSVNPTVSSLENVEDAILHDSEKDAR